MIALLFTLTASFFFTNLGYADSCYDALTSNYTLDARSFHFSTDEFDHELGADGEALAVARLAAAKVGCKAEDIQYEDLKQKSSSCRQLIPGNHLSNVCYVATNLGYFIIHETLPEGLAVTYSRWD